MSFTRAWIPAICAAVFALLYVASAWLYPGGTKGDPNRVGFSLADNVWCNLLEPQTLTGHPNPSRPLAILATCVLCVGLAVLWWNLPSLFLEAPDRGRLVRFAGVASAAATPLIATPWHDAAVDVAVALGTVALAAGIHAIGNRCGRATAVIGRSALALALATFAVWQTGLGIGGLPILQKGAFAALLVWIAVVSGHPAMRRQRGRPAP